MGIAPSSASGGCGGRLSHAVTRSGFADRDDSELDESRGGFLNGDNGGGLNHGQYSGLGSGSGCGQPYSGGDVIRRCNCYSMSLDRKCYRHSLTFSAAQPGSGEKTGSSSKSKKKRSYGFATFKKKLIGKRRHCKGNDHGRCFREHFVDCPSDTLKALSSQYEALTMLRDLSVQANLARPPAATLGQSLAELFVSGCCSDIDLVYRGHRIPAHRTILMARCPYFSRHLAFTQAKEFQLRTRHCVVSQLTIKRLLTFLYTGQPEYLATSSESEASALATLEEEFGIPNSLESDASFLIDSGSLADCKLVFTQGVDYESSETRLKLELTCHKTILAARSGFFRRLLQRRMGKETNITEDGMEEIQLDDSIIPARYGYIILHAMYVSHSFRDNVLLKLVSHASQSAQVSSNSIPNPFQLQRNQNPTSHESHGNLNNQSGAVSSNSIGLSTFSVNSSTSQSPNNLPNIFIEQSNADLVKDIMNLYEIGRFLEFNFLSQSCEDVLMQLMTTQNVIDILQWSLQAHGSAWIARQAQQFLEEDFFSFSSNPEVLGRLDENTLIKILKSDFTQASESELLKSIIQWGEQQFKMKNKDMSYAVHGISANSLGSSNSTLSRKSAKRSREVCDGELKDILANAFPHVRIHHILPRDRNSEIFDMALARNLFPFHPLSNFASQSCTRTKFAPWDPRTPPNVYTRPRLFLPYYEECKNIIQERCMQDPEIISSSSPRPIGAQPDTLYMLRTQTLQSTKIDGENGFEYDTSKLPDKEMISKMLERLEKLLNGVAVQRALSVQSIDHSEIVRLAELRVVRECNLPDSYTTFLDKMRSKSIKESHDETERTKLLHSSIGKGFHSSAASNFDFPNNDVIQSHQFIGAQGPDVTLATNALSSMSFDADSDVADVSEQRLETQFFTNIAKPNLRTTPFRLGTESPDLVSTESIDRNRTREDQVESHRLFETQKYFEANPKSLDPCISDTNLGILNFKSTIEGTTPSLFKGRNVASWNKKNTHHTAENFDASVHNQMKIHSSSLHQPSSYVQQSMSQESTNNIIPSLYQSQHNEFTQNEMPSVLNDYTIQSTSESSTRNSQSYSATNPHMYL